MNLDPAAILALISAQVGQIAQLQMQLQEASARYDSAQAEHERQIAALTTQIEDRHLVAPVETAV